MAVSETSSTTYSRTGLNVKPAILFAEVTIEVFSVSFPTSGIASRAFTAKFIRICSIWEGSALVRGRSAVNSRIISTILGMVRLSSFST